MLIRVWQRNKNSAQVYLTRSAARSGDGGVHYGGVQKTVMKSRQTKITFFVNNDWWKNRVEKTADENFTMIGLHSGARDRLSLRIDILLVTTTIIDFTALNERPLREN